MTTTPNYVTPASLVEHRLGALLRDDAEAFQAAELISRSISLLHRRLRIEGFSTNHTELALILLTRKLTEDIADIDRDHNPNS